jgi:zinc protease
MNKKIVTTLAGALLCIACDSTPSATTNPDDATADSATSDSGESEKEQKAREAAEKRAMLEALPPLPGIEKSKPIEFPKPVISTLDNGLQLVVVEDHEVPRASVQMLVKAGDIYAPSDNMMVATLAAMALTEGTTKNSKAKLDEKIDATGGSLSAGADEEIASLRASVLRGDVDLAMKLMAEELQHPAYEDESLTKLKDQIILGVRQEKANPQALAMRMGSRILYGDKSPYGRPFPTEENIQSVTRDQVQAFHAKHYVPNNAILLVVGDVDAAAIAKKSKKYFGKWKRGEDIAVPRSEGAPTLNKPVVHIIDRSASVQANIGVLMQAPRIGEEGWLEIQLLNKVLSGGTLTSRLNLVLREQLGLTYGAYSMHASGYDGGALFAGGGTKNSSAGEFADALIDLMYEFGEAPVPEGELNRVKSLVSGRFALESEEAGFTASKTRQRLLYDLPENFWSDYRVEIDKLDSQQLLKTGKSVMDRSNLQLIAVGKARKLKRVLGDYGEIRVYNTDLERIE